MRIRRLSLRQYGKFETLDLQFPDTGLCVVYGENEAGKSSSLAALSDLLFGFTHQTDYAFRYPGPQMRVGAALVADDGRALEFWRRKGRKGTLRDDDDREMDDDALLPFLGQADRELFERAFGLSHERLRKGGEAMLRAGGEIGDSLIEAGAGIGDLPRLREELEDQAGKLYGPRKVASKAIYHHRSLYDDARRRKLDASLSPKAWAEAVAVRDAAERRHGETLDQIVALEEEYKTLARHGVVAPILREIDRLVDEIGRIGTRADLPTDAALRWQGIEDRLAAAQRARDMGREKLEELDRWLEDNPEPEAWLSRAAEIAAMRDQLGEITKNLQDIPLLETECAEARRGLSRIYDRLGLHEGDPATVSPPDDLRLNALGGLVRQGTTLRDEHAKLEQRKQGLEQTLKSLAAGIAEREVGDNPTDRLRILDRLRNRFQSLEDPEYFERQLGEIDRRLEENLAVLPYWSGPLESLLRCRLPGTAHVVEMDDRRRELEQLVKNIEGQRDDLHQQLEDLNRDLARLETGTTIPTKQNLQTLRMERDRIWQEIKADAHHVESMSPNFERLIKAADDAADRRESEAGRIAEFENVTRAKAKIDGQLVQLDGQLARTEADLSSHESAWTALWTGDHFLDPGPPSAMLEWMDKVEGIRSLAEQRAEAERALEDMRVVHQELVDALLEFGAFDHEGAPRTMVARRLDGLEVQLTDQADCWQAHRDMLAKHEMTRSELDRIMDELEMSGGHLEAWRQSWSAFMRTLGHPPDTSPEQGEAALDLWREARTLLDRVSGLERRISSMRARCDEFDRAIGDLRQALSCETLSLPEIAMQLDQAGRLSARRADRMVEREQLRSQLADEERAHAAAVADRAAMLSRAGAENDHEMIHAIEINAHRRELEGQLAGARARLRENAPEEDEQSLREMAGNLDPQVVRQRMSLIEDRLEILKHERESQRNDLEAARGALARLGTPEHADRAAQDMQTALSNLSRDSRRWIRLRAAAVILKIAMEKFRTEQQNPLLNAASRLFEKLTAGSFTSLGIEFDQKDVAVLVGLRPDGERVDVTGMSDGSLDQLYLALRLAAVTRYNEHQESMPFIGDDLFLNFDDGRAEAAIALLGDWERDQVILFTHHAHFVDLARRRLADRCHVLTL